MCIKQNWRNGMRKDNKKNILYFMILNWNDLLINHTTHITRLKPVFIDDISFRLSPLNVCMCVVWDIFYFIFTQCLSYLLLFFFYQYLVVGRQWSCQEYRKLYWNFCCWFPPAELKQAPSHWTQHLIIKFKIRMSILKNWSTKKPNTNNKFDN